MKKRSYLYNASGIAVDEKGNFVSIKKESTETLRHRKKLLFADVWRCRKVRPNEIKNGKRDAEQAPDIEKSLDKSLKALERIDAVLKTR